MRVRRNLEDTLGLGEDAYDTSEPVIEEETSGDLLADLRYVKKKLKDSMKVNQEIVQILLEELRTIPHPRIAEVAARLLETMSNSGIQILQASKTVAEIYKIGKDAEPKNEQTSNTTQIKNAIFVGTLKDVFKLQDARKDALESGDPYATE